jgi:GrpB-like predicted nucleotidyltransferase (UPF0157 family)
MSCGSDWLLTSRIWLCPSSMSAVRPCPGCAAKPIIDLDIVVSEEAVMPELISRLTGQGYRHEGDLGIRGREAFQAPPAAPEHHLYGVVAGSKPHLDHVLLRDYLRQRPD